MQYLIQNRPGASTFDWEATGVKLSTGPDGKPTYQYTYSAYDPKGKVPVSAGTIAQWKAATQQFIEWRDSDRTRWPDEPRLRCQCRRNARRQRSFDLCPDCVGGRPDVFVLYSPIPRVIVKRQMHSQLYKEKVTSSKERAK